MVELVEHVSLGDQKLEIVESFFCLTDWISPNGGCEISIIGKICSACGKFYKLVPLSTNQGILLKNKGKVCNSCIRLMFYCSECWALTIAYVQRLQRNDHPMIRWIGKVQISDKISSDSSFKLCLKNLGITLQIVYAGLVMFVV